MDEVARFRGCLLGLAAGDAVGTTVEFEDRGTFEPVTGMDGGGPFGLKPGQWTDDTSMALCLASSLVETGGFDARDQMDRYCRWVREGYWSSTGKCFDIGVTVSNALARYVKTGEPLAGIEDPRSAGNGSIMRLGPVPMFWYPDYGAAVRYSAESSLTTHGAAECVAASRLLGGILFRALAGEARDSVLFAGDEGLGDTPKIAAIARGEYRGKTVAQIAGSGYVVESLEAALWCFWTTESFEGAILAAANLGDDADTTAAICGQVAGAFYGDTGIPETWLQQLFMRAEITSLADRLRTTSPRR